MVSVFTYGTLQVPTVMQAVTGRDFNSRPAILSGYQRFKFKDKTYPGIIKNPEYSIEGVLYSGIDPDALTLLDEFEDVAYDRCLVEVMVNDQLEEAFVYIVNDEYKNFLSEEEWRLEEFERRYLKKYLKDILSF